MRVFIAAAVVAAFCSTNIGCAETGVTSASIEIIAEGAPARTITIDQLRSSSDARTIDWTDEGKTYKIRGVRLEPLLQIERGVKFTRADEKLAGWKQVVVASARDGYQAVFSYAELNPILGPTDALVVFEQDGKPLDDKQGPLRLVVPTDKLHDRGVWALSKIQIVDMRKFVPAKEDRQD